jgi:hypothetical protein
VSELERQALLASQDAAASFLHAQEAEGWRYRELQWEMQELRTAVHSSDGALQEERDRTAEAEAEVQHLRAALETQRKAMAAEKGEASSTKTRLAEMEVQTKAEKKLLSKEVKHLRELRLIEIILFETVGIYVNLCEFK